MASKRSLPEEENTPVIVNGFSVLVNPPEADIDIVFVHGFTGHPERTWTHKGKPKQAGLAEDTSGRPSKFQRLLSNSHSTTRQSVYWPRDLLPAVIPNARVLTYGYDTNVRHTLVGQISKNTVYDIAWNFLIDLNSIRQEAPNRRILFVAHSLGGIVVKEALRRSSACFQQDAHKNLAHIQASTCGIIFFGTPHSGADPRNIIHRTLERLSKGVGFKVNEQIVATLLPSSERLRELCDEFKPMVRSNGWLIHSFQEQHGVGVLAGEKVVEDTSSRLGDIDIETPQHIGRNHMEMCQFYGPEDIEFCKVKSALTRVYAGSMKQASHPTTPPAQTCLSPEQEQRLMDALEFDQLESRQASIKIAHSKTCKWLLQKPEYKDWTNKSKLEEHHGFFWIKGNPATGKSTMMKFLHAHISRMMKTSCIISFFFNARGESLERSTVGMYRSLLYQLLHKQPKVKSVFLNLPSNLLHGNSSIVWDIETLQTLFQEALRMITDVEVVIFIDALDECPEDEVRDMVRFLETIAENNTDTRVRKLICLSSRHYPYIVIEKGSQLILEGQEGHQQDIANYVEAELKAGSSVAITEIKAEILERAAGIFLWVILVVKILNKAYSRGRTFALRKQLDEIPDKLEELFVDILKRDSENPQQLVLCLQWILCAKTPLKREELYFAILSGGEIESPCPWNRDEVNEEDMTRFILSCSKGLADVTKSKKQTVQFIHESVREFLRHGGLRSLDDDLGQNFIAKSHDALKTCCLAYIMANRPVDEFSAPRSGSPSKYKYRIRDQIKLNFPFLEYAVSGVFHHADAAHGSGISQESFCETFPLQEWSTENNIVNRLTSHHFSGTNERINLYSRHGLMNLTSMEFDKPYCVDKRVRDPDGYVFAAIFCRHEAAFRALTVPPSCICAQFEEDVASCSCFFTPDIVDQSWEVITKQPLVKDHWDWKSSPAVRIAVDIGDVSLLKSLLRIGNFISNLKQLQYAIDHSQEHIVQTFFRGTCISSKPLRGLTIDETLRHQLFKWPVYAIRCLLSTMDTARFLDSMRVKEMFEMLLTYNNGELIELYLSSSWKNNSIDLSPKLMLAYAAWAGDLKEVKALLHQTSPNNDGSNWPSPLYYAVQQGHSLVVRELLKQPTIDVDCTCERPSMWYYLMDAKVVNLDTFKLLLDDPRVQIPLQFWSHYESAPASPAPSLEYLLPNILHHHTVNVNARSFDGETMLSVARKRGHTNIVKILLNDPRTRHE